MADAEKKQRTAFITDEQWQRLRLAAAKRANAEDTKVSVAELLRRGAERELQQIESDGYELPEGYDG